MTLPVVSWKIAGRPCKRQIESVNNLGDLRTEFYGRADLANWLRQHPGVGLWVRERLGLPLDGWRPFGRWSKTPLRDKDTLICEAGVVIALPEKHSKKLDIPQGIDGIRQLVRDSGKAVRIAGLSGVGKTRIVQALFEDTVGTEPLDKSQAIYTDLGESPDPSARAVLERLIADRRSAIIILDNCPSGTHNQLAADVAAEPDIRLITVEYDIRDDKPEETRVVRINAEGSDVAETLVKRRHPGLGQVNAYRIAEFSGGNARLALALADAVRDEGSLSTFSDQQLFERLFYQRGVPDANLMMAAEVLALVYSFSIHREMRTVWMNSQRSPDCWASIDANCTERRRRLSIGSSRRSGETGARYCHTQYRIGLLPKRWRIFRSTTS